MVKRITIIMLILLCISTVQVYAATCPAVMSDCVDQMTQEDCDVTYVSGENPSCGLGAGKYCDCIWEDPMCSAAAECTLGGGGDANAPTFSNEKNGSDSWQYHHNFTANFTATDDVNLSHVWIGANNTGPWINNTPYSFTNKQSFNLNASFNISVQENKTVCWRGYANDTSGNKNSTPLFCFMVNITQAPPDLNAPTFSSAKNGSDTWQQYHNFTANFTATDNINLSWVWISTNASGSWVNNSKASLGSVASYMLNSSWNISVLENRTVCWQGYANDTSSNLNKTNLYCFTVNITQAAPPETNPPTFSLIKNGSDSWQQYHNFTANFTVTDLTNISHVWFGTNNTGSWSNVTILNFTYMKIYNMTNQVYISLPENNTICWQGWANDTLGNINSTALQCFTIALDTIPPVINDTCAGNNYIFRNRTGGVIGKINCQSSISAVQFNASRFLLNGTVIFDWFDLSRILLLDWLNITNRPTKLSQFENDLNLTSGNGTVYINITNNITNNYFDNVTTIFNITNNMTYYVNTTNNVTTTNNFTYYINTTNNISTVNNVTFNVTYYINTTNNITWNITQNFTYYINTTNNITWNITQNYTYYINTTNNITWNITQNYTYYINTTNNITYYVNTTNNISVVNNITSNFTYYINTTNNISTVNNMTFNVTYYINTTNNMTYYVNTTNNITQYQNVTYNNSYYIFDNVTSVYNITNNITSITNITYYINTTNNISTVNNVTFNVTYYINTTNNISTVNNVTFNVTYYINTTNNITQVYNQTVNESILNANSSVWWAGVNSITSLYNKIILDWMNITGRPTALSNFTNDLGFVSSNCNATGSCAPTVIYSNYPNSQNLTVPQVNTTVIQAANSRSSIVMYPNGAVGIWLRK